MNDPRTKTPKTDDNVETPSESAAEPAPDNAFRWGVGPGWGVAPWGGEETSDGTT